MGTYLGDATLAARIFRPARHDLDRIGIDGSCDRSHLAKQRTKDRGIVDDVACHGCAPSASCHAACVAHAIDGRQPDWTRDTAVRRSILTGAYAYGRFHGPPAAADLLPSTSPCYTIGSATPSSRTIVRRMLA